MANNYTESSSFFACEEHEMEKVKEILAKFEASFEGDEECGFPEISVEVCERGLLIYGEETINLEHKCELIQALLEGLECDTPFTFSWAHSCSKPRPDEFGGGSCVVRRGKEPVWVDATSEAMLQAEADDTVVCELIEGKPHVTLCRSEKEAVMLAASMAVESLSDPECGNIEKAVFRESFASQLQEYGHVREGDYEVHVLQVHGN